MNTQEIEAITQLAESLKNNRRIFGLNGLAEYLQCSIPTAKKIAESGVFPKYQAPNTKKVFFIESEVLKGIASK